jgi:hypothetical protein
MSNFYKSNIGYLFYEQIERYVPLTLCVPTFRFIILFNNLAKPGLGYILGDLKNSSGPPG